MRIRWDQEVFRDKVIKSRSKLKSLDSRVRRENSRNNAKVNTKNTALLSTPENSRTSATESISAALDPVPLVGCPVVLRFPFVESYFISVSLIALNVSLP